MTWLLLLFFASLLLLTAMAQGGRDICDMLNRCSWLTFCGGVAVAFMMGRYNPWAGLCMGLIVTGMMTTIPWSQTIQRSGEPAVMAAAMYLALVPLVTQDLLVPILWVFVSIGCWAGAWTVYSGWRGKVAYQDTWGQWFGLLPRPMFVWHEDSPTHLKAGQGNSNHLICVAVLCIAASVALVSLGYWPVLLTWPLLLQPLLARVNKEGVLSQGHVHLVSLGAAYLAITVTTGASAAAVLIGYGVGVMALVRPWVPRPMGHLDGSRFAMWHAVITECWWPQGWRRRLLGIGTGTWESLTANTTIKKFQGVIFTTAHNEYLQWLVEHGIFGLLALSGYVVDVLVRLWSGGPQGQALFLMAIALCSIAATNFPWTAFHQIEQPPSCTACNLRALMLPPGTPPPETFCRCSEPRTLRPTMPLYVGSPSLVAMSLVIGILVEAF